MRLVFSFNFADQTFMGFIEISALEGLIEPALKCVMMTHFNAGSVGNINCFAYSDQWFGILHLKKLNKSCVVF